MDPLVIFCNLTAMLVSCLQPVDEDVLTSSVHKKSIISKQVTVALFISISKFLLYLVKIKQYEKC